MKKQSTHKKAAYLLEKWLLVLVVLAALAMGLLTADTPLMIALVSGVIGLYVNRLGGKGQTPEDK